MITTFLRDSRHLAALAVPIAMTQLAQVALTTTDTVMMGLIGTEALAAGGLAIVLFNQLRTMGVGLVTAVGNQVAAAVARGEAEGAPQQARDEVRDIVRAAFVLATLAGIAGAVIMVGLGQALPWLGQDEGVVAQAWPMIVALAPGLVPCLWFQVIRQYTVGMRRPQALVWITVGSVAVNAALNWALIHGSWGLPALGLAGIGLATAFVHLLSFLVLLAVTRRDAELASMLSLRMWRTSGTTVGRLTRLGLPIAATYGSEAGFFSVVALLVGSFGAPALAAHTVVNQLVYIVFQVTVGLSHGASINVSREVALGNTPAAARVGKIALALGGLVMAVIGVVYLVLPSVVLRPFLDSGPAVSIATSLLVVAAALQFFDCAQNIGVGLLRGLDDTKAGLRMTLIGYWLVGLPAAWLLGRPLGLDAVGVWLGLLTGLATTAALLLARFRKVLTA